ncbi:MAG: hypothetical protein WKF57_20165 [Nakamurella sp.]
MSAPEIPQYQTLLWPTVVAMRDLGGSGSIEEIVERVLKLGDYTDAQQAVLHKDGPILRSNIGSHGHGPT